MQGIPYRTGSHPGRTLPGAETGRIAASPHLAAQVELAAYGHFNLLNHSIWRKPSGRHSGCKKESLHRYFPQTEHIVSATR
jgi:adenine-specific DNA-methyltransferase